MSLGVSLKTAATGLQAAQASLRVVSDNIANVNTPGYVRKAADQHTLVVGGVGMGVKIDGIRRVTDQYLQGASLTAASDAKRWDAVSQYLDTAQSLFGDPSSSNFFFNRLDKIYASFATAADDPTSTLLRSQALSGVQDFLTEADRINSQLVDLGTTMDTRINASVSRANDLLDQINTLNSDITRAKLVKADSSGSENIQSQLLDELAGLMNVRVNPRDGGGVDVRSAEGVVLAGDGAAKLAFVSSATTPGYITATPANSTTAQPIEISSGEIRGLLDVRDQELPKLYDQLGEFISRATEQINAAHNASAAYPAPATLTGRDTGLDVVSAGAGFTGQTTIDVVNAAGAVQRKIAIDFTAGTISVNGGPTSALTLNLASDINTALGGSGTASFTNGVLSLSASGGNGIAIDEGTSDKTGRGFSHFFGLNDLVKSTGITNYETGLKPTDNHGFTGQFTVRLSYPDGRPIRDITITAPAAPLVSDLMNSLNSAASGVGLYGSFALDSNGHLAFTGDPSTGAEMSIVSDNTQRGASGPSISQLFGLGSRELSTRAGRFQVNPALQSNPALMALGQLDSSVAVGQIAIRPGDGRGGVALSTAGETNSLFQAAGSLGQVSMTVSRYAAEFGGSIGRAAASAETRKGSAEAVASEATSRRQSVEGVNLDEELVNLTTYQQAFNAAARMIQATSDLLDTLMQII